MQYFQKNVAQMFVSNIISRIKPRSGMFKTKAVETVGRILKFIYLAGLAAEQITGPLCVSKVLTTLQQ